MFACGGLGERISETHPVRRIRALTDEVLAELRSELEAMYAATGRPSIPPEQMLRALLLQMLYTVRSERRLVEQMQYDLLFRWFIGLGWNGAAWDASSFSKNRERLLSGKIAAKFLQAVVSRARAAHLLDDERFSVDGTLIEAWASEKSYQRRSGPPPDKGSGAVLLADTHESRTDPEARLYRKGVASGWKLRHMAHAVSDNQHGLVVATGVSTCSSKAERHAALDMARQLGGAARVMGADKGYHEQDFVEGLRQMGIQAHVPPYARRRTRCWVDPALYQQPEYAESQRKRKWIERFFSWLKTSAGMRKTRHRGHRKLDWNFTFAAAAYNLIRMSRLLAAV